jgi:hypothetical protein
MPELSASLLNGFARNVVSRFAERATGLDDTSARFVKARPSERILCGFVTPVDNGPADEGFDDNLGPPDLPADDKYEQTHVGFEWLSPALSSARGFTAHIDLGFNVYARVWPTFQEARENARFSYQGRSTLVEVWQRYEVAGRLGPPISVEIEVDRLMRGEAIVIDLEGRVANLWNQIGAQDARLFRGRREPALLPADLESEERYRAWVAAVPRPERPRPLTWRPVIDVRGFPSPTDQGARRILLRLVNYSGAVDRRQAAFADPRLYAVQLEARFPIDAHQHSEFGALPKSYRYDRRVDATGINCDANVIRSAGQLTIQAKTVPVAEVPRLVPREIAEGEPTFEVLAHPESGPAFLEMLARSMGEYDVTVWESRIRSLASDIERSEAIQARDDFRREISDFRDGVRLLAGSPEGTAARAFRLMNETMLRSGRSRRQPIKKWHLFQLVFLVSQLPKLVHAAESSEHNDENPLSILWIPAGGGKTEAFLGLIVWHAFYDRLRAKALGVTAFVRYPLRLLTYQQLQRTSWVLGQAEELRIERRIPGEPFSLGYYVGESTTPNRIDETEHSRLRAGGVPPTWQRVFRCPSCGERSVHLRYDPDLRLVEHYCQATACRTRGSRLPVFIVDDDLYRYLPTVIVSTVDKLAQLGQNRRFAQLLGRVDLYCPIHGAAFRGSNRAICPASQQASVGNAPDHCAGAAVRRGPFAALQPSLHVQDEMHLLRESLATFDSHYETAALSIQRALTSEASGWSLIGATATIEGFQQQAAHLYLRSARRFPSPGPEAYESFYYTVDPQLLGRLYVGVFGVGRTHTPAVARSVALLYGVVEFARTEARRDLDSARVFIGLPNASREEIETLAFLYEIVLNYVLTRKGGDQVSEAIDTRVRREVEIQAGGELRIETFHSNVDMPRMIATMEEIEGATPNQPIAERVRGVVATNIISHGVDVDRFNIIVFAGFPRLFAEYIQASARVGRQLPGIVALVVTPQSERDRSVLDRFVKFHRYVDRLVEPVPINRWSEPALEQTVRGILASYLMAVAPSQLRREVYLVSHVKELFGMRGAECLNEDAVVEWVVRALGVQSPTCPPQFAETARRLAARFYGQVTGCSPDHDREPLNSFLNAMRSLRDVDDPGWITVRREADVEILSSLGV